MDVPKEKVQYLIDYMISAVDKDLLNNVSRKGLNYDVRTVICYCHGQIDLLAGLRLISPQERTDLNEKVTDLLLTHIKYINPSLMREFAPGELASLTVNR